MKSVGALNCIYILRAKSLLGENSMNDLRGGELNFWPTEDPGPYPCPLQSAQGIDEEVMSELIGLSALPSDQISWLSAGLHVGGRLNIWRGEQQCDAARSGSFDLLETAMPAPPN